MNLKPNNPTLPELHAMAQSIGIHTRHFQNKSGKPHYDICRQNKLKATHAKKAFKAIYFELQDRKFRQMFNE
jgi:hypothetical protein